MDKTKLRAKIYKKLVSFIESVSDDVYFKKVYNGKVYYIAYTSIDGFRSFLIGGSDKIYLFIEEELTEQERVKELAYVFNGNMDYYSNEEVEEIKRIANSPNLQFKLINNEDVEAIISHATLDEYGQIGIFSNELNKFLNSTNRGWNTTSKLVYMFKLGVMQGKREERARKGKGNI
ncbi:hypothetical protein PMZ66_13085 [Clostridium paraputrificum]|uniref:hypothetical protein n=1 Tax=Clostridium paraputrificum TaxID=29363 RepID=UPI00232CD9D2|nr:hypothetical protein [Clostridium paraputrificum]MDB2076545.1 hypothetical protein [Clostridium paraputrificum]MDB2080074.1 hypothetical protein [Clostridium paraputrificum]